MNNFFKIIKDTSNWIKINWQINESYRPYLIKKKKTLEIFDEVNTPLDEKVNKIYQLLKDNGHYQKEVALYDEINKKIQLHNQKVVSLKHVIEKFNFNTILENPEAFSQRDLEAYFVAAKEVAGFKSKSKFYTTLIKAIKDAYQHLDVIKIQSNSKPKIEQIISLAPEIYYDGAKLDAIETQLKPFKKLLKSHGQLYYDFNALDQIKLIVEKHNQMFIQHRINLTVFDNINSKSLDQEQREAILKDEVSLLVVAGAGSGKSTTICGKVKYLIEIDHINPKEILVLSYSKKSIEDLQSKILAINKDVVLSTFHKIGLEILKDVEQKTFVIEEQFKAIIEKFFREELNHHDEINRKVLNYFAFYASSNDFAGQKFKDEGQQYAHLKSENFETLKNYTMSLSNHKEKKLTLKKEFVKSFEELAIANFYFLNGIKYTYEKPYQEDVSTIDKRQYLPDFFLDDYHIYHEHFGVDKDGNARQYQQEEALKYLEGIKWKRQIHEKFNTVCMETYSYEFDQDKIFEKITETLKSKSVKFDPISNQLVYQTLNSIYQGKSFKSFINLLASFINLYKTKYHSDVAFETLKHNKFATTLETNRAHLFLDIARAVYQYYMQTIRAEEKIDFDDMILKAIISIDKTERFQYKYIIVDEFQDISNSRMELLKALLNKGKGKLFAVGDDWQAIYRYAGCDIGIFVEFSKYFKYSSQVFLTTTHRNSQELQRIACDFIKKNPEQIQKTISSNLNLAHPINIVYYQNFKSDALRITLGQIHQLDSNAKVLLIGRNNIDEESVIDQHFTKMHRNQNMNKASLHSSDYPALKIEFSTAHSAKGLEADFVIIINADDKRLGFPNKMEDDPLLNLVLSSTSKYQYAEERRLWYVALTRTKSFLYILVDVNHPSVFVQEIKDQCQIINPDILLSNQNNINCPYCKSGHLVTRVTREKRHFMGCSNYPYCRYSLHDIEALKHNIKCPRCGDFLISKHGHFGAFIGCNSFPSCDYTQNKS
jgi:DNA helicase-4